MTISSAFHSALSGLVAARRASGVVSDNIANAMTPGFARRSLALTSNAETGPGVQVAGVTRHADPVLLANRRAADAGFAAQDAIANFHEQVSSLIGAPGDPASVGQRMSAFQSSLIEASSRPESQQRLDSVAQSAKDLTGSISSAAEGIRTLRTRADHSIGDMVTQLNDLLGRTQTLNVRITAATVAGSDTAALIDQRQNLIDSINDLIPVNIAERPHGQLALYSDGGAILLDGQAARLDFSAAPDTMPHMTQENGLLSGLSINGIPVRTSSDRSAISGGALAAQFQIRDELAVSVQSDLDGLARDLVERFQAPGPDPTQIAGDPGLFTDAGNALDATAATGLSGRLALSTLVDPARGGDSWKLRAGLNAANPGDPGDARLLNAWADALTQSRPITSDTLGPGLMTAESVSSLVMSRAAQADSQSQQALSFASASRTEMQRLEQEQGVDTDAELQTLMIVEQSYAANARILQAVDGMMKTILEL